MNKYKKEELRKHNSAREGKSASQIEVIDLEDEVERQVAELTRKLHLEMFPEEYDVMMDDGADANMRKRGINPMSQDYIDRVNKRRQSLGVSELDESGRSVDDTTGLCRDLAEKRIYSGLELIRPPASTCVMCDKSVEEVGGYRIASQQHRGVTLSDKPDVERKNAHQALKLYDDMDIYVHFWGEAEKWSEAAIERAMAAYRTGHRPWFCQVCGERTCPTCGAPLERPIGSDVLSSNGHSTHVPILPAAPGCVNPKCSNHKAK